MTISAKDTFGQATQIFTSVIANAASLGAAVSIGGLTAVKALFPAGTEGTILTFQVSFDGVTYSNLYKDGVEYSITVAAGQIIWLDVATWFGISYFKPRTGTAASPTNQTGAATLTFKAVAI